MIVSLEFLRSLCLTSAISFALPLVLIGGTLTGFVLVAQIPLIDVLAQTGLNYFLQFLQVFGTGSALQGALVIGCVCGLVGALFDTYAFYRHHKLRQS
jgi:uncharacterized membrane protein